MPIDILLDENFEVAIDHTGDIATVSGRDEFEQRVRLALTEVYQDLVSEFERETILSMAELRARRVARQTDEINGMPLFDAEFSNDTLEQIELTIVYDTGESTFVEVSQ